MDQEHRYFYEVCKTRNITKAAHNLFISQPALSTAIKKLEQRLGVKLLDRKNSPLTLTQAGRIYLNETEKIKLAEEDMFHQIDDVKQDQMRTIFIGSSQYFNSYYLPKALKTYQKLYPKTHFKLIERNAQLLNKELYEGNADIVIHVGGEAKGLTRYEIQPDQLVLAIPKNLISGKSIQCLRNYLEHHDDQKEAINLLTQLPFISLSSSNNLSIVVHRLCQQIGFLPHTVLENYQLETAFHMANSGIGATFVTKQIQKFAMVDNLYFLNINYPMAQRIYYAFERQDSYQPKYIQKFIDVLRQCSNGDVQ